MSAEYECSTPRGIIGIFTSTGSHGCICERPTCSTPFGIMGSFTFRRRHPRNVHHRVLNASRHHGKLHVVDDGAKVLGGVLLNASRHHGKLHTPDRFVFFHCFALLNASRHHWNLHGFRFPARQYSNTCSTPRGIIGIFTIHKSSNKVAVHLCSTPRGIVGIFTRRSQAVVKNNSGAQRLAASLESSPRHGLAVGSILGVLNAFRHHWNLHLHRRRRRVALHGLRVLNAFRHHWNLHNASGTATSSTQQHAQRLSASLESSRPSAYVLVTQAAVLNAFRHHWNLHSPLGPHGRGPGLAVLNAFRHHWNLHQNVVGDPEGEVAVLNAFRHHWNLHPTTLAPARRSLSAQRLSASLESSLVHLP